MKLSFNVIDLFSGCGGSALGFAQAGFNIKVAVDIDIQASASFKLNFPNTSVITSDICYVSGKELLKAGKLKNGNNTVIIVLPVRDSQMQDGIHKSYPIRVIV
jgi:DNA (cytosine-5)-methyltransferase 1